jgi:hypothetical protein
MELGQIGLDRSENPVHGSRQGSRQRLPPQHVATPCVATGSVIMGLPDVLLGTARMQEPFSTNRPAPRILNFTTNGLDNNAQGR